jgi:hypothetical protein
MNYFNNKKEVRNYVKILFSESGIAALHDVRYFKNDMTVMFYMKWKWYFEYRAALLKVQHPKALVEYRTGPYEYVLPDDEYKMKVKNHYLSNKRQQSKFKNKINLIRKNWSELFPIEEHPDWKKVNDKLNYYKEQFELSKKEYDLVFSNQETDNLMEK